jgi:hypothetical protein
MATAPRGVQLSPQQQADLASLAYELGHSTPESRADFAKIIKKHMPDRYNRSFRDVAVKEEIQQLRAEVDDKLDLNGARAAKARQESQKEKLKERYSEEQIGDIQKVMARYGVSDWKAGATLYAAEHPESDPTMQPPSPSERPGATWEFPTVAGRDGKQMDFKTFAGDPRTHSLNAAYNVITDFKNKSLSPGFRR